MWSIDLSKAVPFVLGLILGAVVIGGSVVWAKTDTKIEKRIFLGNKTPYHKLPDEHGLYYVQLDKTHNICVILRANPNNGGNAISCSKLDRTFDYYK